MIIDMSLNASGVRDTVRSLHICPNTVRRELKKKETALESVNTQGDRTILTLLLPWVRTRSTAANAAGLEPGTQARAPTLQTW